MKLSDDWLEIVLHWIESIWRKPIGGDTLYSIYRPSKNTSIPSSQLGMDVFVLSLYCEPTRSSQHSAVTPEAVMGRVVSWRLGWRASSAGWELKRLATTAWHWILTTHFGHPYILSAYRDFTGVLTTLTSDTGYTSSRSQGRIASLISMFLFIWYL